MKQYMESNLPLELVEAARIDGSGEFNTFNKIVFPLMKPAIAVQAILPLYRAGIITSFRRWSFTQIKRKHFLY